MLLGVLDAAGGVPFYIGGQQYEYWAHTHLTIDVVPGRGGGFSLETPEGFRFLTRSRLFTDEESELLEAAGPTTARPVVARRGLVVAEADGRREERGRQGGAARRVGRDVRQQLPQDGERQAVTLDDEADLAPRSRRLSRGRPRPPGARAPHRAGAAFPTDPRAAC